MIIPIQGVQVIHWEAVRLLFPNLNEKECKEFAKDYNKEAKKVLDKNPIKGIKL